MSSVEQNDLQLLKERVHTLLNQEPIFNDIKDNLAFNFERPNDLLRWDIYSLLLKPASLSKILGHKSMVYSIAFSPDSKLLASASYDNTVRLWNIRSGKLNAELKGHKSFVSSVAFSPDGKSIVTGSADKTVRTWSIATKQQVEVLKGHSDSINSVAWSPNGDVIASGSQDTTVILWDAISGSAKKTLTAHTEFVVSVSFSQNGNKLASAGNNEAVIIWDVHSAAALIKLAHSSCVWSVCFSPDDEFVVTGCSDGIVRMFNANNGHKKKQFEGHNDEVCSVAISFDGSMIASGGGCSDTVFGVGDKSVRLWDIASNKQLQQLDGHTNLVNSVAFSRDGKFMASASSDETVRLWNAPSVFQSVLNSRYQSPSQPSSRQPTNLSLLEKKISFLLLLLLLPFGIYAIFFGDHDDRRLWL